MVKEPEVDKLEQKDISYQLLIINFFHEVISRIVPGLVVVILFFPDVVRQCYAEFHDSYILFGLTIFIIGWLIGTIVDVGFYSFIYHLRKILLSFYHEKKLKVAEESKNESRRTKFRLYLEKIFGEREVCLPKDVSKLIWIQKLHGEATMFRGLALISIWSAKWTPKLFLSKQSDLNCNYFNCEHDSFPYIKQSLFLDFQWHDCYGRLGFVVFMLAWLLVKEQIEHEGFTEVK